MTISRGRNVARAVLGGRTKWYDVYPAGACVICGCTQDRACPEGCSWVIDPHKGPGRPGPGLCDVCLERVQILLETPPLSWHSTLSAEICRWGPLNTLALARRLARGAARRKLLIAAIVVREGNLPLQRKKGQPVHRRARSVRRRSGPGFAGAKSDE